MSGTSDPPTDDGDTGEDVDHVVDSILHGSDTQQQAEQDSREPGEPPGDRQRLATTPGEKSSAADSTDMSEIESMIDRCDVALDELERKIEKGRVRDPEAERVRAQWVRTMSTMLRTKRQLIEAKQVDELADRVAELEEEIV